MWRNFAKLPKLCKLVKHRESYDVAESGDFGKRDEYGETSPNCQTYRNKLSAGGATILANLGILTNVTNRQFRQIRHFRRIRRFPDTPSFARCLKSKI